MWKIQAPEGLGIQRIVELDRQSTTPLVAGLFLTLLSGVDSDGLELRALILRIVIGNDFLVVFDPQIFVVFH